MNRTKTKLSVNVNKIATLRNARGKNIPDLIHISKIVLQSQAHGLTVHPRPDERHIRRSDVFELKNLLKNYPEKEFNIEGYPSTSFVELIKQIQPQQCTLVPDPPDVLTSRAGWNFARNKTLLKTINKELSSCNIRVSLFLDPLSMNRREYDALQDIHPHRVEFYTEHYAESWNSPKKGEILSLYKHCASEVKSLNIKINAGHDLNQDNLFDLLRALPEIQEVSIGQALIAAALEKGLNSVIQKYIQIIDRAFSS